MNMLVSDANGGEV